MATSQVAVNKIFNARDEGRTIPEGWGVDEEGRTTTDPGQVFAAVPLGGYKGYALAVLVEVLSGVLSGSGVGHGVGRIYEGGETQDVGHFHLAIDPERLAGREHVRRAARRGCSATSRRSRPRPASTRCSCPASPRRARRRSASATASRSRRRCGRRSSELSAELGVEPAGR